MSSTSTDAVMSHAPPDGGLTSHAMQAMTSAVNNGNGSGIDMASVLAKIQSLEREKQTMSATLQANNTRLAKFQEGKKAEMEAVMNSTISKWLEGLDTKDDSAKQQLKSGLQTLINEGNESGVWNVIACASSNWASNVNSIESLTNEVNSYKVSNTKIDQNPESGVTSQKRRKIDTRIRGYGIFRHLGDTVFSASKSTGDTVGISQVPPLECLGLICLYHRVRDRNI